jgi:hypothetical protein
VKDDPSLAAFPGLRERMQAGAVVSLVAVS